MLERLHIDRDPTVVLRSLPCPVADDLLDDRNSHNQSRFHVQAVRQHHVWLRLMDGSYNFARSSQPSHASRNANDRARVIVSRADVIGQRDDGDFAPLLSKPSNEIGHRCGGTPDVGRKDAGQDGDAQRHSE